MRYLFISHIMNGPRIYHYPHATRCLHFYMHIAHASYWYKNIFVNRMHSRNTEYSVRRRSKNIICQSFYSFILIALKCRLTHWSQTHFPLKMHSKTNASVKYFKENVCSSAPHFNGFIKSSSNFICEECNLRFPSFFILFSLFHRHSLLEWQQ